MFRRIRGGPGKGPPAAPRRSRNGWPASVGQVPAAAVEPAGLPDAAGCGCSSGVSPERDDPPGHGAGTRKPRLSLRLPGSSWLRFGARRFLALLFQLPRGYQHDRHGRPCHARSAPGRLRRYGPECSPLRGRECAAAGAPAFGRPAAPVPETPATRETARPGSRAPAVY